MRAPLAAQAAPGGTIGRSGPRPLVTAEKMRYVNVSPSSDLPARRPWLESTVRLVPTDEVASVSTEYQKRGTGDIRRGDSSVALRGS